MADTGGKKATHYVHSVKKHTKRYLLDLHLQHDYRLAIDSEGFRTLYELKNFLKHPNIFLCELGDILFNTGKVITFEFLFQ